MATSAYIKTAASHLRSAVADLQQEIRIIQSETDRAKWQLNNDISSAESERSILRAELVGATDPNHRRNTELRIRELEQQIGTKKQQVNQQSNDAAQTVQSKTGLLNDLQNTASQLESKSGLQY